MYMFLFPSYPGCRSPKICILKCRTMVSTTSLSDTNSTCYRVRDPHKHLSAQVPVDPSRTFLGLDLDVIVIHVDLRDLHLEVVGEEPDGFPHRAKARTPRRLEQSGRGGRAWGEEEEGLVIIIRVFIVFNFIYINFKSNKLKIKRFNPLKESEHEINHINQLSQGAGLN